MWEDIKYIMEWKRGQVGLKWKSFSLKKNPKRNLPRIPWFVWKIVIKSELTKIFSANSQIKTIGTKIETNSFLPSNSNLWKHLTSLNYLLEQLKRNLSKNWNDSFLPLNSNIQKYLTSLNYLHNLSLKRIRYIYKFKRMELKRKIETTYFYHQTRTYKNT